MAPLVQTAQVMTNMRAGMMVGRGVLFPGSITV